MPAANHQISTCSKSLSGDRWVQCLPPSRYKVINCHIPVTSRLTTTYPHTNKVEDQPLRISWHLQGYNFEALCRTWGGTAAYEPEVALHSPVRSYDPECRAWRVFTSYVRLTLFYPFTYPPIVRRTGGGTLGQRSRLHHLPAAATSTALEPITYVRFQMPVYFIS